MGVRGAYSTPPSHRQNPKGSTSCLGIILGPGRLGPLKDAEMQMEGSTFTNTNEAPISSKSFAPSKLLRATSLQEVRQLLKDCTRVGGHCGRGGNMTPTWASTPASMQLSLNSAPSPDQMPPSHPHHTA